MSRSIFVDESGTSALQDADGKNRFYVSAAVIIDTDSIHDLTCKLDEISREFNHGATFKSSKIGKDDKRRLALLKKIGMLAFRYAALVVDKSKVAKDSGLQYKSSFYKYMANYLYRSVDGQLMDYAVDLYVDSYGSQEFQQSCVNYFEEKGGLFGRARIMYNDDKTSRLVQLADVVAGTLRRYFSDDATPEFQKSVRALLRDEHEVKISSWPFVHKALFVGKASDCGLSDYDKTIAKTNIDNAVAYIEKHDLSQDEDEMMRVAVLKMLLEACADEERSGNIFADAMIAKLEESFNHLLARQFVQSKIIGVLRLQGIVIAGEKNGYRLATSERSLRAYLAHNNTVILPMLAKLTAARSMMRMNVGVDPLDRYPEYKNLKTISDAFNAMKKKEQDEVIMKGRDESLDN